jgi:hypothetical protein
MLTRAVVLTDVDWPKHTDALAGEVQRLRGLRFGMPGAAS